MGQPSLSGKGTFQASLNSSVSGHPLSPGTGSAHNPKAQKAKWGGVTWHPAKPLKVPAVEVDFPRGSGGMGSAGSTAEPHTRRQPQQKSGGSSRDLKPQPGTKGGAEGGQGADSVQVTGRGRRWKG